MLVAFTSRSMSRIFLAASSISEEDTIIKLRKGPRELAMAAVAVVDKTVNKAANPRELRRCNAVYM